MGSDLFLDSPAGPPLLGPSSRNTSALHNPLVLKYNYSSLGLLCKHVLLYTECHWSLLSWHVLSRASSSQRPEFAFRGLGCIVASCAVSDVGHLYHLHCALPPFPVEPDDRFLGVVWGGRGCSWSPVPILLSLALVDLPHCP